uniref:Hexose transporter 1 n=2 Tax=Choreotrichia TaxID=141411 RepID=A0A7S3X432_9SPIT|mmetsp:Transcript_30121/g.82320  ORF Transcript_30121/g.82320 Transcript_30121/m.82320 type:complete len:504 (-) Transcript_30121:634-2145(-)|eukprot:scaffold87525_cov30-Tisochrysis_lutea.AAC.1
MCEAAPAAAADEPKHPRIGCTRFLVWIVSLSAISSIISGYDQGVIAGAMLTLQEDLGLTGVELELCVGVINLAAALGGIVTGAIADAKGRRWTITLSNVLFLLGSLLLTIAEDFFTLMVGRVFMGLGVGIALVAAPIFTAEISPAHLRGSLVAMSDVATNAGILLGYAAGLSFYGVVGGWRYMFAIGMLPAGLLAILIWTVPESPRWLAMRGRDNDALAALVRIGDKAYAEAELESIRTSIQNDSTAGEASWKEIFFPADRPTARMLTAGLGVAFFSQACGTEAVTYYIPEVMVNVGLSDYEALVATMGAGGCKVLCLLFASQLFDRLGRRPMLLISAFGLAASFGVVSASYSINLNWLSVVGVCGIMGSFSLGFSPLVYVVGTEVFPNRLRAKAMSLALFITRMLAGIVSISFISLEEGLGPTLLWASFSAIAVSAMVFIFFSVPETMGLELEDVAALFTAGGSSTQKKTATTLLSRVTSRSHQVVEPSVVTEASTAAADRV